MSQYYESVAIWSPFNQDGLTLITAWLIHQAHYKVLCEIIIHLQTSTVAHLNYGNRPVISFKTSQGIWMVTYPYWD